MGKLEELLAGCPRKIDPDKNNLPWQSFQAFPGFMIKRMHTLLFRPREAIGEFGAGDYQTPFCYFLFFTIILAFLQNLASLLQMSFFMMYPMQQPTFSNSLEIFFSNSLSVLIFGTCYHIIYQLLFLGISVIILALGLWSITGVRSWNPAFTISAYCLPVQTLLFTILAFVQMPRLFSQPVSESLGLAFTAVGIIFAITIAVYGIIALAKTPVMTAIIIVVFWIAITILVTWIAWSFVVLPAQSTIALMISPTFFPR